MNECVVRAADITEMCKLQLLVNIQPGNVSSARRSNSNIVNCGAKDLTIYSSLFASLGEVTVPNATP